MAYQNVATPRFYVSWGDWYRALGFNVARLHTISPYIQSPFNLNNTNDTLNPAFSTLPPNGAKNLNFIAVLNHDLTAGFRVLHRRKAIAADGTVDWDTLGESEQQGVNSPISYPGFSIMQDIVTMTSDFSTYSKEELYSGIKYTSITTFEANIGCLVWGRHYDMTQNPNLSLTKSIDYGETKEITTYNGSSISNTMATGIPAWGSAGAWELGETTSGHRLSRTGRRKWDLTFSFLDDGDMWGSNQSISNPIISSGVTMGYEPIITGAGHDWGGLYELDDINHVSGYATSFQYNLLTDDSRGNFFSSVWHKTLGGTLPFIFQPDKDNNHGDQFAICKFVSNSLKVTQSAFHVYDVSVSIEEVW